MTEVTGFVEITGKEPETAVLLLAAAETLALPSTVVRTTSDGFIVPVAVADEAGIEYATEDKGLSFRTRALAEAYADDHDIVIEDAEDLSAADYKAAVAAAAKGA